MHRSPISTKKRRSDLGFSPMNFVKIRLWMKKLWLIKFQIIIQNVKFQHSATSEINSLNGLVPTCTFLIHPAQLNSLAPLCVFAATILSHNYSFCGAFSDFSFSYGVRLQCIQVNKFEFYLALSCLSLHLEWQPPDHKISKINLPNSSPQSTKDHVSNRKNLTLSQVGGGPSRFYRDFERLQGRSSRVINRCLVFQYGRYLRSLQFSTISSIESEEWLLQYLRQRAACEFPEPLSGESVQVRGLLAISISIPAY